MQKIGQCFQYYKCFGLEALHKWDEDKRTHGTHPSVADVTWLESPTEYSLGVSLNTNVYTQYAAHMSELSIPTLICIKVH